MASGSPSINVRVLENSISGITLMLVLRTRMKNPYVYEVFLAPVLGWNAIMQFRKGKHTRASVNL